MHDGQAAAGNLDPEPAVPTGKGFAKLARSRKDGEDVGRDVCLPCCPRASPVAQQDTIWRREVSLRLLKSGFYPRLEPCKGSLRRY